MAKNDMKTTADHIHELRHYDLTAGNTVAGMKALMEFLHEKADFVEELREYIAELDRTHYLTQESADRSDTAAQEADGRAEVAERVVEAAQWCLPLAKGYAAAHPVGSNAKYVAELESRLAAYTDDCRESATLETRALAEKFMDGMGKS